MSWIHWAVSFLRELVDPDRLNLLAGKLGGWLYLVLFAIVFAETGLVVIPFLPGDSLLFAVGAVAAMPGSPIDLTLVAVLLSVAAVLGDAINYSVGKYVGPTVFSRDDSWLLNKKHLSEAHDFYERYGGKTIILARFIPIIRTFAPFVAGIGRMNYLRFALYNVVGGVGWILICLLAGRMFGNLPMVRRNFEWVLVAIVAISVLPAAIEIVRGRIARRREAAAVEPVGAGADPVDVH